MRLINLKIPLQDGKSADTTAFAPQVDIGPMPSSGQQIPFSIPESATEISDVAVDDASQLGQSSESETQAVIGTPDQPTWLNYVMDNPMTLAWFSPLLLIPIIMMAIRPGKVDDPVENNQEPALEPQREFKEPDKLRITNKVVSREEFDKSLDEFDEVFQPRASARPPKPGHSKFGFDEKSTDEEGQPEAVVSQYSFKKENAFEDDDLSEGEFQKLVVPNSGRDPKVDLDLGSRDEFDFSAEIDEQKQANDAPASVTAPDQREIERDEDNDSRLDLDSVAAEFDESTENNPELEQEIRAAEFDESTENNPELEQEIRAAELAGDQASSLVSAHDDYDSSILDDPDSKMDLGSELSGDDKKIHDAEFEILDPLTAGSTDIDHDEILCELEMTRAQLVDWESNKQGELNSLKEEFDSVIEVRQSELELAKQAELDTLKNEYERQLECELEALESAKQDELESLKLQHARQLSELESAKQAALETQNVEFKSNLEQLDLESGLSKQDELDCLESDLENRLEQQRAELELAQQAELDSTKAEFEIWERERQAELDERQAKVESLQSEMSVLSEAKQIENERLATRVDEISRQKEAELEALRLELDSVSVDNEVELSSLNARISELNDLNLSLDSELASSRDELIEMARKAAEEQEELRSKKGKFAKFKFSAESLSEAEPGLFHQFRRRLRVEYRKRKEAQQFLEQAELQREEMAIELRRTKQELREIQALITNHQENA